MDPIDKSRAFLIIFFIALSPFAAHCSTGYGGWLTDLKGENSGHAVGYFLTLPVSANELSAGASSSCGSMDATDVCFFPANTALLDRRTFSVTHIEWLLGLRKEYCSGVFPLEDIGALGFFSQIFTPGKFTNAYTIDETPSAPSLLDFSAGMSFARSFLHKSVSTGISVSYVESRLDLNAGRTFCVNTDVSVVPSPFVLMHLRAGNIGPKVSYTPDFPERLPLQAAYAMAINPLALREDLCAIVEPQLSAGVSKIADEPLLIGLGARGKFFRFLALRGGYEFVYGTQPGLAGLSGGLGLERNYYGADFGWKKQSKEFGSVWSLSVNVRLKETIAKKAEDFYFIAREFYGQGRLRQSLSNAKKAVALDPNMWKAHALISEINALKRRKSGVEMALIYSGNAQGRFVPEKIENGSLGGLSRLASVIRDLRSQFPLTLAVDAGNNLTHASHESKARLADWFFDHCAFDARGLGKGEIDFGFERIFAKNRTMKCDFVCSNCAGSFGTGIVGKKIITVGNYTFALLGAVGPAMPARAQDREKLLSPVEELSAALSKSAIKSADVRILIVNDSWERVAALADALPQVEIVLCSGVRQKFETPMKIGNALVISPGEGGYCVGKLILRFDGDKKIISYDNHLIALNEDIAADPEVAGKLPTIEDMQDAAGNVPEEFGATPELSSGVFAFVSDRDSTTGIYLKRLDRQAEFPLTRGRGAASKPVLSFACGKCAYFENQSDSVCPVLRTMDLSGVNKWTVPFTGCATEAVFSPDGKWLYFSGTMGPSKSDIYRIKPGGAVAVPIISWKNTSEGSVEFSADGKYMAFTSDGTGGRQLFLADSIGFKPICLTDGKADNYSPRFSPSGEHLAFLSNLRSFRGSYDLWMFAVASGKASQTTYHAYVKDFCWLDDAKTLVYSSGDTLSSLKTITVGIGAGAELIRTSLLKDYSELHPRIIQWLSKSKIIYAREMRNGDRKIYWVNPDGTDDQRIVNSKGQDWLE
jgi:hypothetical protein